MEYYLLGFKYHHIMKYCIWMTDHKDRIYCDGKQDILTFDSQFAMQQYALSKGIKVDTKNGYICEMDHLQIGSSKLADILDFWNLTSDITKTVGVNFIGNRKSPIINKIYNKLFHGCNLLKRKATAPYIPRFSPDEIRILEKLLEDGKKIIKRYLLKIR